MREEHLDLLAPFLGDFVECVGRAAAGKVAHHLVFSALEAARVAVGAAFCFQRASQDARFTKASHCNGTTNGRLGTNSNRVVVMRRH